MKKYGLIYFLVLPFIGFSQNSIVQEGELCFGIGAAHYFGDLNTSAKINRPKPALTAFFRKNMSNYIAFRVGLTYAQLGYSDIYNTHNTTMVQRNLSFNTSIWELALQGDFNFFKFLPGEPGMNYTPYVTFGVGAFNYDPYAYLNGEKFILRPLGTEGQGTSQYPDRLQYSSMAFSIPFGAGFKYAINERMNVGFEVLYRFSNTDYLDDVSKTYVDPSVFPALPDGSPSPAFILSDRSIQLGNPIGIPGRQRGSGSKQKDHFATAMFFMSLNLQSYKCPPFK